MKNSFLLISVIIMFTACKPGEPKTEVTLSNSVDTLISKTSFDQKHSASFFSEVTCPKCNHTKTEKLPTEYCLVSYTCENCKEMLHPKDGDCCVFCSYGTHNCPSKRNY